MTPMDIRNETWETVRARVTESRAEVLHAWHVHGPGTTRQVAKASGIDLLTLRPRTTDLVDLGFVEMIGRHGKEGGIYRAVPEATVRAAFEVAKARALLAGQQQLHLGIPAV